MADGASDGRECQVPTFGQFDTCVWRLVFGDATIHRSESGGPGIPRLEMNAANSVFSRREGGSSYAISRLVSAILSALTLNA